ncbi:hypothetical protein ACTFIR_009392 [Dictyostelium discoideum]
MSRNQLTQVVITLQETVAIVNPVVGVVADLTTSMDHQVMLHQVATIPSLQTVPTTVFRRTRSKITSRWTFVPPQTSLERIGSSKLLSRGRKWIKSPSTSKFQADGDWDQSFPIPQDVKSEISHWLTVLNQWNGKEISLFPSYDYVLTTDASESGAGATLKKGNKTIKTWSFQWSTTQSNMSSNRREMLALLMAYQALWWSDTGPISSVRTTLETMPQEESELDWRAYSRILQCKSRPPQPSFRDESQIVVQSNQELQLATEEGSVQSNPTSVRSNPDGSVRISPEPSNFQLLNNQDECTPPRLESMEAMSGLPTTHYFAFYPGEDELIQFEEGFYNTDLPNLEISNLVSDDSSSSSSSSSLHVSSSTGNIPRSIDKTISRVNTNPNSTTLETGDYSTFQSHVMSIIRIQKSSTAELLMKSWEPSTLKVYSSSYTRFRNFCTSNSLNPANITLVVFMDYLTHLFKHKPPLAFSTINGHRSMLNQLLLLKNQTDIVNDPFITRIMTGIHKLRPSSAKYQEIWDANQVFKHLSTIKVIPKYTYTALLKKTLVLCKMFGLARSSDLVKWSFNGLIITPDSIKGPVINAKEQRKGVLSILELTSLDDTNSQVCPVRHLSTYLRASKGRRKPHSGDSVFIQNEGKPLDVKEINIIVLSTLSSSGIDISKFKSHSTRSAMASLLLSNNVPFHVVKKMGRWKSNDTVDTFYDKRIIGEKSGGFLNTVKKIRVFDPSQIRVFRVNTNPNSTTLETGDYSTFQSHVMSIIRIQKSSTAELLMKSWEPSTLKVYSSSYTRFRNFCSSNSLNPANITLVVFMDYLTHLFKHKPPLAFSTYNGHRSMLNQLLLLKNQTDIVNDPFITRIMTGIHKLRPSSAKYQEIWDANEVFKHLSTIKVIPKYTYTALLKKTLVLCKMFGLARSSDLVKWSFNGLIITPDSIKGPVINAKEKRKGVLSILELTLLDDTNSQVCPVRHLSTYLTAMKNAHLKPI